MGVESTRRNARSKKGGLLDRTLKKGGLKQSFLTKERLYHQKEFGLSIEHFVPTYPLENPY